MKIDCHLTVTGKQKEVIAIICTYDSVLYILLQFSQMKMEERYGNLLVFYRKSCDTQVKMAALENQQRA